MAPVPHIFSVGISFDLEVLFYYLYSYLLIGYYAIVRGVPVSDGVLIPINNLKLF